MANKKKQDDLDPIPEVTDTINESYETAEPIKSTESKGHIIDTIEGKFKSAETKYIPIPQGCYAVLENHGSGDIYPQGESKFISPNESFAFYGNELIITSYSQPKFTVKFIKNKVE